MTRLFAVVLFGVVVAAGCRQEERAPPLDPKVIAEGFYLRGGSEFRKGEFEAALRSYDEVEKRSPKDPRLPMARAEVFLKQGRYGDALAHLQEALQRDPNRQTTWARIGIVQRRLGEVAPARVSLEKALEMDPKDWFTRENLAEVEVAAGDVPKAEPHFRRAIQDAPEVDADRLALRFVAVMRKAERWEPLFAFVAEHRKAGRAKSDLLVSAGEAYLARGQLPESTEAYRAAATAARGDAHLWELVGELEVRQKKSDAALEAFTKAIEAQDLLTVRIARMRIFLERKDRPAALKEMERALEIGAGEPSMDPREGRELAEGLLLAGRKEDALKLLATVSAEESASDDVALQQRTAELAKSLKNEEVRTAACSRLAFPDGGYLKTAACPPAKR